MSAIDARLKELGIHGLVVIGGDGSLTGARELSSRGMPVVGIPASIDNDLAGTEMAIGVTRDALQIHGGNGVTRDFIVERLAREAIICPIPDGTTEIQKLIIARALTGIGAFR